MICTDNLLKLMDIVSRQSLPRDDHDHHIFLCPKTMRNDSTRLKFDELVTFYVNDSNTKQRGPRQLADHLALGSCTHVPCTGHISAEVASYNTRQ